MEKVGCTRQFESELSLRSFAQPFPSGYRGCANRPTRCFFFRKPTRPSLPLRKAPHLSPSLSLLRRERMCQPPYSVLKPLRYKVGGPSEVYASSRAAVFFVRDKPQGHGGAADANAGTWGLLLMGTQGHNAGGLWNHLADTPTVLHQD